MKVIAIVQARVGSTRLPGKILKKINGKALIEILFHRLSQSKKIDKIILATSKNTENDLPSDLIANLGYDVFRGSENDVLDRYYNAAKQYQPETVVRITGDCPIIDPTLVDEVISFYNHEKMDYASNTNPPTYPDGLDTEVFSFQALKIAHEQAKENFDREHVTPFIKAHYQFNQMNFVNKLDLSNERWTVDDPEDFTVIENIFNHFAPNLDFSWKEVLELKQSKPEYFKANQNIKRNEGADMGIGQKLWKRANKIIPGGNMLLSKRAEMFLPEKWPAYFDKAKGCSVWDLDGNKYIDMSIMGIGTNVLGFANDEVDNAVREVIDKSNTSTFNCPEEVYLAEKLIELHPWADMVRLARTGGEANSIAVRIARAASGKDKIAFCGYHGWHDWYLAANLSNSENLEGHLLSGLEPAGVPNGLEGSAVPFDYNDYNSLKKIVDSGDVGVIMMEVSRNMEPKNSFLQKIRQLATDNGIVLIFDEITSGFRVTLGGSHLKYGVEPDMAVFGKTMGNGYAISAVIGKSDVMEYAQSSFISSTFWTERIGPVAALKTIEIMERDFVPEQLTETGEYINKGWSELADQHDLDIQTYGLPSITHISFKSDHELAIKTLITQEMLKKGYLAGNSVYVCIDHSNDIVDKYMNTLDESFRIISKIINGEAPKQFLDGPICHGGFKRLN
ncbi:aminotransferase class III-fold pyridoxal phosphate-dependent enzyme [candidate division KSB1 bacterium]|nr:aminotransferase class III-fold pyridoxal phosphate-dependent enzyme [candidate division KSB1 bacterium]